MDKNDPDSWFEHEFGPTSRVADYANAPPRGMTNPPMNRQVRKALCKDFVEYGLPLQVEDWEGGLGVPRAASAPVSPQQRLARSSKAMGRLTRGYMENIRTGRVLKKGSCFSESAPAIVGGGDRTPPVPPWHQYHPSPQTLRPIDKRGPAATPKTQSLSAGEGRKERRSVHFADAQQKTLEDHIAQQGSPQSTFFIKTPSHEKALTVGRRMSFEGSGRRPSIDPAASTVKKSKDPSKEGPKEEEAKKKKDEDRKHVEESQLEEGMRCLRGMSQLHRAAVTDRFRFGADSSKGAPMVLGASTLHQANPGNWSSDAAFLNKFHNSAIRIHHPSGLQKLEEPAKTKRKKKKKVNDDDDELKMSDSGLFVPKYPIDGALKALRRVRKKAFPEHWDRGTKKAAHDAERASIAATALKMDFGGCLLSSVRVTDDEQKELEYAMLASGY